MWVSLALSVAPEIGSFFCHLENKKILTLKFCIQQGPHTITFFEHFLRLFWHPLQNFPPRNLPPGKKSS